MYGVYRLIIITYRGTTARIRGTTARIRGTTARIRGKTEYLYAVVPQSKVDRNIQICFHAS